MNSSVDPNELQPWLVVLGSEADRRLAMWQLASPRPEEQAQLTLAIFSTEQKASDYAVNSCSSPWRVIQVARTQFLSLIVDCFRQGIRYATLNPGESTAQSVFVLRDVLLAAKRELASREWEGNELYSPELQSPDLKRPELKRPELEN